MKKLIFLLFITLNLTAFSQQYSADATFNIGSGSDGWVATTAIQTDGKIIIGGSFTSYNGNLVNNIVRLNVDGSFDPSFVVTGYGFNGAITSIDIQTNGKIIVGGFFSEYNSISRRCIARINIDGTLDFSFNPGTGFIGDYGVTDLKIISNERILVGGDFWTYNGVPRNGVAILNSTGSLDNTFYPGLGLSGSQFGIQSVLEQPDGKIIAAGYITNFFGIPATNIVRINPDGSYDNTFSGYVGDGIIMDVKIQPDGKIVTIRGFDLNIFCNQIARLNTNGTLDQAFNTAVDSGFEGADLRELKIQPDGKIIVGGGFSTFNSIPRDGVCRINTDGTIDNTFNPGTGLQGGIVASINIQDDGKIIIGGGYSVFNGTQRNNICRLVSCNSTISDTISLNSCAPYISQTNQTYYQSGLYKEITQNVYGCDSIITTLNLIINSYDNLSSQVQIIPTNCSSPTGLIDVNLSSENAAIGTNIYISEYFSGNGYNKSIEIYNPTNQPIDLGGSFPSPTGNTPSSSLVLSNSAGQLFSFPANTILPAYGTILVSTYNSIIPSDFYSFIIDGSDITLGLFESFYVPILGTTFSGTSPIDIAISISNSTSIRNNSITSYNPTYTPSEWLTITYPSSVLYPYSLGEHYNTSSSDYHIEWTNGTIGNSISGITDGIYTFNVVNNQTGCVVHSEDVNVPTTGNNFNTTFSSIQQLFTSPPFAVQFSNTTASASNYSFEWLWGDGTTTSSNNASVFHEYLYNGQYTVSLIATDNVTGCSDTTTITDYIFCTGGASCTHTASINQQGPIQACEGTNVWLTCNTDPSFTYQWRRDGVNIPGNNNDSLLVTQTGNYTVTIYVNNCPVTSNGISVTINPLPSIPTITSSGTITSCSGGSLTLAAPVSLASYSWNTGATNASIVVTQSGNYTVTVTNASGCARTSDPYVVNASFMSSPNVCVVGMDSLTNENRIVWEKPLTSGIDSFYVYKETNVSDVYTKIGATDYPDLAVFLDQNSNPAVQAYRYKLTVLDTCGTETLLSDFHKTIHLTINAGVGGAWNLIWSHYEGLAFGSYNIYRGTDPTNISLLTTIQSNLNSYSDLTPPVGPVYYQIEIVNPNSCDPAKVINYSISRSNIVNNGVNDINELANTSVQVYPNPTSDNITITSSESLFESYLIFDSQGRKILEGNLTGKTTTVDMSCLARGNYLLQIGEKKTPIKLIKQ